MPDIDPCEQVNQAHNNAFRAELKRLNDRLRQRVADTADKFSPPEFS